MQHGFAWIYIDEGM